MAALCLRFSARLTRQSSLFLIQARTGTKKVQDCDRPVYPKPREFPLWYLQPIADPKKVKQLEEEGKLDELKLIPVVPAAVDFSVSVYQDRVLKKFINIVMKWGERVLARQLVFDAMYMIKRIQFKKYHKAAEDEKRDIELNPRIILKQAIDNCKPMLYLNPIKKGGITYQVPTPITQNKSEFMAMKWLVTAAGEKEGPIRFEDQLVRELLDAYHNEGRVIRKKQELHRICEANKAYAHYRWS